MTNKSTYTLISTEENYFWDDVTGRRAKPTTAVEINREENQRESTKINFCSESRSQRKTSFLQSKCLSRIPDVRNEG